MCLIAPYNASSCLQSSCNSNTSWFCKTNVSEADMKNIVFLCSAPRFLILVSMLVKMHSFQCGEIHYFCNHSRLYAQASVQDRLLSHEYETYVTMYVISNWLLQLINGAYSMRQRILPAFTWPLRMTNVLTFKFQALWSFDFAFWLIKPCQTMSFHFVSYITNISCWNGTWLHRWLNPHVTDTLL